MIQYTNEFGNVITIQQASILEEYDIRTIDDNTGKIKILESIRKKRNGKYKSFDYFLESNEDKNSIIQQYIDPINDNRVTIYSNKQSIFEFDIWDYEDYFNNGILKTKAKEIFDSLGRTILYCSYDLQTNEIKYIYKVYHGTSSDVSIGLIDLELRFDYRIDEDTNQMATFIKDVNETTGEIHTMTVDEFIEIFGQAFWDAHPYYHTMLPLLPTSANI